MSDTANPFQSPEAGAQIVSPLTTQGSLTSVMVKYLRDASPWLRFLGIMGFIGSGLMVLVGLTSFASLPFAAALFDGLSGIADSFIGSLGVIIYALYFLGAGVLIFFPALFTYRFGVKIRNFILNNSEAELELAFRNNALLWKFQGILMIIGLAAVPVLIIISIVIIVATVALPNM